MPASTLSLAHIIWAFGIGSAYVFWPIIGRYSGAPGAWISIVVTIGTAISSIGLAYSSVRDQPLLNMRAVGLLLVAGLLNGAAFYFQSEKMADTQVPINAFVVTILITMVLMTLALNFLLNGTAPSVKQGFGVVAAILAIALLAS